MPKRLSADDGVGPYRSRRQETNVKILSAMLSATIAMLALALAPQAANAFGNGGGHSGGGGGGHSSGGAHSSGHVGGFSGHSSGAWGGHAWSGRPGGWDGWHHHHFHDGVFFDFGYWGPYGDPWWGWNYPYYYAPSYPAYAVPDTTAVPSAPPPPDYWYYCPSAKAYYPYVPQCPVPWVPVRPTPEQ